MAKFNKNKPYAIVAGAFHGAKYQQNGFYFNAHFRHIPLDTDPAEPVAPQESPKELPQESGDEVRGEGGGKSKVVLNDQDGNTIDLTSLDPAAAAQVVAYIAELQAGAPADENGEVEPADENAPPPAMPPAPNPDTVKPAGPAAAQASATGEDFDLIAYALEKRDSEGNLVGTFPEAKAAMRKQYSIIVQNGDDLRYRLVEEGALTEEQVRPHMKNPEVLGAAGS
jgi:hypothetical protein